MRYASLAAVLALVGCAGTQSDPASVVDGLTQQQIDQTSWVYSAQARDLVAAQDLTGALDEYRPVRVRTLPDGVVLACDPERAGVVVSVLREGVVRPGSDDDDVTAPDGPRAGDVGDIFPSRQLHPTASADEVRVTDEFGLDRFDENVLRALEGDQGFFVFHPGCA